LFDAGDYRSVKAKFHYASWFGAGSKLVRSWFESGSVMEFGFEPASKQLRTSSELASVMEFGFYRSLVRRVVDLTVIQSNLRARENQARQTQNIKSGRYVFIACILLNCGVCPFKCWCVMLRFQVLWCNVFAQLIYTTIKTTSEFRNVSVK